MNYQGEFDHHVASTKKDAKGTNEKFLYLKINKNEMPSFRDQFSEDKQFIWNERQNQLYLTMMIGATSDTVATMNKN